MLSIVNTGFAGGDDCKALARELTRRARG